jgi:hypothetical protein
MNRRTSQAAGAVGALSLLVVSGCASAQAGEVRRSAEAFESAVAEGDGASACGWLSAEVRQQLEAASARPCAQAVGALRLSGEAVRDVEVWGENAQARLDGGVLFLSSFDDGWRVIGAGCTPQGDRRYRCAIGG